MNSGKLLILIIVSVAVVAAGVAWAFQSHRGRRALSLWGSQNAYLIRKAPRVELLVASGDPPQPIDISHARGLAHARQALIEDSSFVWSDVDPSDEADPGRQPDWECALRFVAADREFAVDFDLEGRWARAAGGGSRVRISEKLAGGLQLFLGELTDEAAAQPDALAPSSANTERAPL